MVNKKAERRETFNRDLMCRLTREEVETRAQEAASILERRDQQESQFAQEKKRWQNTIAKLDVEHRLLMSEVRNKTTVRGVTCVRVFDYDAAMVSEFREDTGEVLDERKMTDVEKQRHLDFEAKKIEKEEKPKETAQSKKKTSKKTPSPRLERKPRKERRKGNHLTVVTPVEPDTREDFTATDNEEPPGSQ